MTTHALKVFPDPPSLARDAAERIVRAAAQSAALRARCALALSGGSTPKLLYQLLASDEFKSQIDWPAVEIFFADERCVPPDHPDSNYRMVRETLLSQVPLRDEHVHRMHGDVEPVQAAKEYGLMLKQKFADGGVDLIVLGMGEDGHTASLFPGTAAVNEVNHRVVANYVENSTTGKSWRITMTAPFINRAKQVLILVTGAAKAHTLKRVLEGPSDPQKYPIQLIEPTSGRLTWLIDAPAQGM